MSSGRIAQHRNYGEIMARHERDLKFRRITRIFVYFLIIIVLLLAYLFVRKWENNVEPKEKQSTTYVHVSTDEQSKNVRGNQV